MTWYLGFQLGLDITPAKQFLLVLDSIRQKLAFQRTVWLSLAGRALVVNQVLLVIVGTWPRVGVSLALAWHNLGSWFGIFVVGI